MREICYRSTVVDQRDTMQKDSQTYAEIASTVLFRPTSAEYLFRASLDVDDAAQDTAEDS